MKTKNQMHLPKAITNQQNRTRRAMAILRKAHQRILIPTRTPMIYTLTQISSSRLRGSICQEAKLLRRIRFIRLLRMGLEELPVLKTKQSESKPNSVAIKTTTIRWDQELFPLQKLIEIIKKKLEEPPGLLNLMSVKTTTENSGECIFRMKTWSLILTRQLISVTKWIEKYLISKTSTRTH